MSKIKYPLVVIGAQWGDEGKGKIVDILAKKADYVVRFNGGNNAGHTVVVNGEKFPLSLLPSGVIQGKKLLIAQGVVIDPEVILSEINFFEKRGMTIKLKIDPRVNIVMPYHKELDRATELWKGKKATGSLHLGIGYCYEDKNNRFGIRFEDLINPDLLKEKLEMFFPLKKKQIEQVFSQKTALTVEKIYKEYVEYGRKLKEYLGDVSKKIQTALSCHPERSEGSLAYARNNSETSSEILRSAQNDKQKKVLFEGAHGTFLDGVFGTYPYTTAVYTISGSVFPYVGIPPQKIYTLGVVKAYTTRVGNGPFPTELFDKTGNEIRKNGGEFGTVSKRPRRCGWLDLPLLRTSTRLSGFDYLAVTKLDVLSSLSSLKVCTHYLIDSKKQHEVPSLMSDFSRCRPVFKEFKGWKKDITHIRRFNDLPIEAKAYIKYIEKSLKVPVKYIFVGPERRQTIQL
ncbi:adenylosuccinate synthetase [Candidatus Roizmanbacteria bacterium]|nr:adenylosuccinate synthetase [Candidatus Roizmanbacteria bacterium]